MGLSGETNNEKEKMDVVKLLHSEYSQFNTIYLLSNLLYYIDYHQNGHTLYQFGKVNFLASCQSSSEMNEPTSPAKVTTLLASENLEK